jgi:methionine salvage enolase-phosphatase E1
MNFFKRTCSWISFVQSVFNDTGLSYVFESHFPICMSSINSVIKERLRDQFIQKWISDLDNSAREFYKVGSL